VGGQARGDRDWKVVQPGPAAGDGGKRRREFGRPGHDLEDHLGQVDAREHGRRPAAQVNERRGLLDGLDARQVDLPVGVDADLGVDGQPPADFPDAGELGALLYGVIRTGRWWRGVKPPEPEARRARE